LPPTILIAPPDAIQSLQSQPDLRESQAFSDADSSLALRAIQDLLPPVIAIERNFAASLSGQALIKRIRTDVKLRRCEIATVGIRRASRHKVTESVEVIIDEHPAHLVDISTTGALVLSASALKPRQRIRVVLQAGYRPLTALVVWTHFELPIEGPRYRAGIEFVASAGEMVEGFISTIKRAPDS
jgi:hypothetical protein